MWSSHKQRIMEWHTTHAEPSTRNGRKCTREADRLMLDVTEHVGAPTSQCRQRRSLDKYTRYMALMSECIVTEPSSFEEEVQQIIWVDTMVEEYESIVKKSAWEVFLRLVRKLVVGSKWIYKVKQTVDGSVEKYKAIFVAQGFSQVYFCTSCKVLIDYIYPCTLRTDGVAYTSDACENFVSQWIY